MACNKCAEKRRKFQEQLEKDLDGKTSPRELRILRRKQSIKAREERIKRREARIKRRNQRKKDDDENK